MNEKRFTFDREVEFEIYDNVTKKSYDGTIGCQEKICQLLNELNEENEQLKERVKVLEKLISDVEISEGMSIDNLIDTEMITDE